MSFDLRLEVHTYNTRKSTQIKCKSVEQNVDKLSTNCILGTSVTELST